MNLDTRNGDKYKMELIQTYEHGNGHGNGNGNENRKKSIPAMIITPKYKYSFCVD